MLHIVLVEPEIPQNCGNVARTCAATRSRLHLVEPLGFDISDRAVKRAGLDYWPMVDLRVYPSLDELFRQNPDPDLWLATTKAPRDYAQARFRDGCWLFFGKEASPSLPGAVLRPVSAHPHAPGRPESEPGQLRGHSHLRGSAPAGLSRVVWRGRNGTGRVSPVRAEPFLFASRLAGCYGTKHAPSYVHDTISFSPGARVPVSFPVTLRKEIMRQ